MRIPNQFNAPDAPLWSESIELLAKIEMAGNKIINLV